jgi:hypothetical protein
LHGKRRMKRKRFSSLYVIPTLLIISHLAPALAQQLSAAEVRKLLAKSRSHDRKISNDAKEALSKLDAKSLPALVSILKKGTPCEQVAVAELIIDLDTKSPDIVSVMTEVTRGASLRTLLHPQEEMMCRRAAAYVLARSADGIPVLTRLLREGDLWERQTAIFALDDLTETSNYPDGSLPAMKELIPEIANATKAKDRVLSEMADEVLGQVARGSNAELSALAKKYTTRRP